MAIEYGLIWYDGLQRPRKPISEDEARALHERGEPYVAFVHDVPGRRDVGVELALWQPSVVVSFLDDRGPIPSFGDYDSITRYDR